MVDLDKPNIARRLYHFGTPYGQGAEFELVPAFLQGGEYYRRMIVGPVEIGSMVMLCDFEGNIRKVNKFPLPEFLLLLVLGYHVEGVSVEADSESVALRLLEAAIQSVSA